MSEQGDPAEPDERPGQHPLAHPGRVSPRVALYFIADGLIGIWPDAGSTTRVVHRRRRRPRAGRHRASAS